MPRSYRVAAGWMVRTEAAGSGIAGGAIFYVFAWFLAIPSVMALAQILDKGGTRSASSTITYVVVSVMSMVEAMSETGMHQSSMWCEHTPTRHLNGDHSNFAYACP